MTVNEAMVVQKAIRNRVGELQEMRNSSTVKTRTFSYLGGGEPKEQVERTPQYDPKALDKKIVELEIFLFKIDTAIKVANAQTKINIEVDIDKLLAPIE